MGPCSQTSMGWWVPHTPAPPEHCRDKQELGSLSLQCPALPLPPSPSSPAPWWARGQFAGGALEKKTLWSRGKIPWEGRAVMPLISIPGALHFFGREAPTFSSQSKYQPLILCVNRLASAATDDCSFGKFIVAIKRASFSLSLPSPSLFC